MHALGGFEREFTAFNGPTPESCEKRCVGKGYRKGSIVYNNCYQQCLNGM